MAWNHKSRIVAVAIAIQSTPGTFAAPNTTSDLIACAPPQNQEEIISAEDPTATGTIWQQPRVFLGKTMTATVTIPLRGPGGSSPPAANAWPVGRLLQAGGCAEIRVATDITSTLGGSETTSAIDMSDYGSANATDNYYVGMPIQQEDLGPSGIKLNSIITAYNGTTKVATFGETLGSAPAGGDWKIPANLTYQLGTLTGSVPLLSMSIWRDKKRYDIRDIRISQWMADMPVANTRCFGFSTTS